MSDQDSWGPDLIQTTDEEGKVHFFEKIDDIEFEGKRYALLVYQGNEADAVETPNGNGHHHEHVHSASCSHGSGGGEHAHAPAPAGDDDDDEEGGYEEEIVLMRVSHDGDSEVFEAIEDDDEFNRVLAYIESLDEGTEIDLEKLLGDADDQD